MTWLSANTSHGVVCPRFVSLDHQIMSSDSPAHRFKDQPVASLAGRSCWVVSDGKMGHEVQSLGVAEALDLDVTIKRVDPKGWSRKLAPFAPVSRQEQFGTANSDFCPPWPDVAIGAGRLVAPYMRTLKAHAGSDTFTVILLDPKFGLATADMVWVPQHDRKTGANVISTLTPPHRHSPSSLALLRTEPPPFHVPEDKTKAVVLLGGPNGRYTYSAHAINAFVSSLRSLIKCNVTLLATPSRRTPEELIQAVRAVVEDSGGYFWEGEGENPLAHFYAHGDMFIVPADSINMTAEPCVTGRPIYVFHPDGGSEKFTRFHQALSEHGATRPLPKSFTGLETWSYPPLFSADTIAEEIVQRWSEAQGLE